MLRERLIDDVPKCFGDLDCIFSLLRSDQVDSMTNVGRREFRWVTSSGLLKLRMLLRAKPGDGRDIETSGRCKGVSRLASIKHREDGILLSRGEGSHDDGDWK